MGQIRCSAIIPASPAEVFDYLIAPHRLHLLVKEFIEVELQTKEVTLNPGAEIHYTMQRWGFVQPVGFRVVENRMAKQFTYQQIEGLFANWTHTQSFSSFRSDVTQVVDLVNFEFPMGWLGHLAADVYFKKDFKTILSRRLDYASEYFQNKNNEAPK